MLKGRSITLSLADNVTLVRYEGKKLLSLACDIMVYISYATGCMHDIVLVVGLCDGINILCVATTVNLASLEACYLAVVTHSNVAILSSYI